MDDSQGYAVFFFPQAIEALGEAIKPYLKDGPGGPHVLCKEIDTGGALVEMSLDGQTPDGQYVALELMVPTSMVRMIVSARTDEAFGFGPRIAAPLAGVASVEPVVEVAKTPGQEELQVAAESSADEPAAEAVKAAGSTGTPSPAAEAADNAREGKPKP